jgi:hypothetical protein
MSAPLEFDRPQNPLYQGVALRHVVDLPVLGVPVHFASNSAAALAVVEDAFGRWRALAAHPELIASEGVQVRLIVHEGLEGSGPHAPVTCRMPDTDRIIVHTPGSVGIADCGRREATAYVTPALLLGDRAQVRYSMIEGLTLMLVTARDRYPVHAAAIMRGPVALLLAGPPGSGKSTLAYQAYRHGLRVLSDDAAYVQLKPTFRLWGMLGPVRLLPDTRAHFPELAGQTPAWLANGNEKFLVPVSDKWPGPPVASGAGVCLLERQGGAASCARASATEVHTSLEAGLGVSRVRFGDDLHDALARLAARGGWRLSLSANPADALPFIDEMLTELKREA